MLRVIDRVRRPQPLQCSHPQKARTTNFGLERVVCVTCGHVEMRNLSDVTVVRAKSLRAAAAAVR